MLLYWTKPQYSYNSSSWSKNNCDKPVLTDFFLSLKDVQKASRIFQNVLSCDVLSDGKTYVQMHKGRKCRYQKLYLCCLDDIGFLFAAQCCWGANVHQMRGGSLLGAKQHGNECCCCCWLWKTSWVHSITWPHPLVKCPTLSPPPTWLHQRTFGNSPPHWDEPELLKKKTTLFLSSPRHGPTAVLCCSDNRSDVAKCLNRVISCGAFCSCQQHFCRLSFPTCITAADVLQTTTAELGGPFGKKMLWSRTRSQSWIWFFVFLHSDAGHGWKRTTWLYKRLSAESLLISHIPLKYD